ncbi:hypothetical protein [Streptomyces sp. NBC_01244]|uniref:hypothetical protein n=1 Tax=Streptomyces sp. NBC_01244 TaxID=2903797 RepID=UPI002E0FF05D|nr:hypothetical protein OG247_28770 [Streptomyces sp. NBC_01244]
MITFDARRNPLLTLAAAAVALTALSGCEDSKGAASATASASASAATPASAAPAAGAFDPEKALAEAGRTPYAATMKASTQRAGKDIATTTGRGNFETLFTGRMETRPTDALPAAQAVWTESVMTADGAYVRDRLEAGGAWVKMPASADSQASYTGYAKLLLATGPSARKGMEDLGGIPAYHLAGRLDLDQIASVDPRVHRSMKAKGVTGFGCDQWIDAHGRTLRFEQRMETRGMAGGNKVTFGEFGPVETFEAPTIG